MQTSTFTVKGNTGFGLHNRRILQGVSDLRSRNLAGKSLRMTERNSCFGVSMDSASMGIELGRARRTVQTVFGSSAKSRSHRVRAADMFVGLLHASSVSASACEGVLNSAIVPT